MKRLSLILALACSLNAGDGGLRAPITGFVLDPAKQSLVPILGLPGASTLGSPLALPFSVSLAAVGANGNALAVEAGTGRLWLVGGLQSGDLTASLLDGAIVGADRIAVNQTGSAAVLYAISGTQVQFVSGLGDRTSVSAPISLAGIPGEVTALSVSADGSFALVGVAGSSQGAIYLVTTDASTAPALITAAGRPVAVASSNQDAIVADSATNEVFLIHDVTGAKERRTVVSEHDGVNGPVAVQVQDDQRILIANAGSQTLQRVDPATGQMETASLSVVPDRIDKLSQPGVYVVNGLGAGPLWLADTSPSLNVVFVPLGQ